MTRRWLTLPGVKPVGPMQWKFEAFYLYGAVAPLTGESFFLELPYLNSTLAISGGGSELIQQDFPILRGKSVRFELIC